MMIVVMHSQMHKFTTKALYDDDGSMYILGTVFVCRGLIIVPGKLRLVYTMGVPLYLKQGAADHNGSA